MFTFIKPTLLVFVFILCGTQASGQSETDTVYLYFLGGQSNMEGYGYVQELHDTLNKTFNQVMIFHGNTLADGEAGAGKGVWTNLKPGHGVDFKSDGKTNTYSNRFGVELSLAYQLQKARPGQKIAFIKYCRGGTSIDSNAAAIFGCWEPDFHGLNQYDHFLATLRNALRTPDIDGDGKTDYLKPTGIFWMQGEADAAFTEELALRYYDHLKRLMDLMRASLLTDDLPVVIGKISDSWNDPSDGKVWNHGELVQYAQEKYARTDPQAAIVRSTRYYKYSDPWHYDSYGYIDLGREFARAMLQLEK